LSTWNSRGRLSFASIADVEATARSTFFAESQPRGEAYIGARRLSAHQLMVNMSIYKTICYN
jgi:hypothetical protein